MEGTSLAFTSTVSNHYGYIDHWSSTTSNTATVWVLTIRIAVDFQCIRDCIWCITATWWKAIRHNWTAQDLCNWLCNPNCSISSCRSSALRDCPNSCKSTSRSRCSAHCSICALDCHEPIHYSCRKKQGYGLLGRSSTSWRHSRRFLRRHNNCIC